MRSLIILIILLFIYYNCKNKIRLNKDTFENKEKVYNYCHIPKTAGSSIQVSAKNRDDIQFNGHRKSRKCSEIDNTFAIIRNPVDRFISSFNYCKYGSKMWGIGGDSIINNKNEDINDFISKLKNGDKDSWKIINAKNGTCGQGHWTSQHDFIGDDTKLACYNSDSSILENNLNKVLKDIPYLKLEHANKTHVRNNTTKRSDLTQESIDWIEDHYSKDLEFWKNNTCDSQ